MGSLGRQFARRRRRAPSQLVAYRQERLTEHDAVMVALRTSGCTCEPVVGERRGMRLTIHHDYHCALLRSGDVN